MTSQTDDSAVNGLTLWVDNDSKYMLARRNIETELARAWAGGYFNLAGAATLYRPLMDRAARDYARKFPPGPDYDPSNYTPAVCQAAAELYAADFVKTVTRECYGDLGDTAAAIIMRGKQEPGR